MEQGKEASDTTSVDNSEEQVIKAPCENKRPSSEGSNSPYQ